jgi:acyltransferase
MGQRIEQLDVAKGFGILLIIIGHSKVIWHVSPSLISAIFLFHVPLFFVLSGTSRTKFVDFKQIPTIAKGLLGPYFFSCFIYAILKAVSRTGDGPISGTFEAIFIASGQDLPSAPLWFLPSLFVTVMAFACVDYFLKRKKRFQLVAMLILGLLTCLRFSWVDFLSADIDTKVELPWVVDLLPVTLFYYSFGSYFGRKLLQLEKRWILVPIAGVGYLFSSAFGAKVDLYNRDFAPALWCLVGGLAGTIFTFWASAEILRFEFPSEVLKRLGRASLVIFIFHLPILNAVEGAFSNFGVNKCFFPFAGVVSVCLSAFIPLYASHKAGQYSRIWRMIYGEVNSKKNSPTRM